MIDYNFCQNYRQRCTVIPMTTVRGPFTHFFFKLFRDFRNLSVAHAMIVKFTFYLDTVCQTQ